MGLKTPTEFEPITIQEGKRLLKEAAKTFSSAIIWTKDQKHYITTHLNLYSDAGDVIYAWIPKGFNAEEFLIDLHKTESFECYVSVSLQQANIFFKCNFKGHDRAGLKFTLPEKVFKVQRRQDVRYTIPETHVMKVTFQDPIFPESQLTKKVIDISAGGLAFHATEVEKNMLHTNLVLKNVTIAIHTKELRFEAEVRHVQSISEADPRKGVKVGVMFQKIKPQDSQTIATYVFEEARKLYTRFM
jgi:c-di-GMP-binding flagellar brake protein YcgR